MAKFFLISLSEGTICSHYFLPEIMKVVAPCSTFFDELIAFYQRFGEAKEMKTSSQADSQVELGGNNVCLFLSLA